jgi:hypothetical protein
VGQDRERSKTVGSTSGSDATDRCRSYIRLLFAPVLREPSYGLARHLCHAAGMRAANPRLLGKPITECGALMVRPGSLPKQVAGPYHFRGDDDDDAS